MPDGNKGVLIIYTGGTIGSKPRDPDPDSPQVVVGWEELREKTPELSRLRDRFPVDCYSFEKPLDSCNVGPKEWEEMARAIADGYDKYEGFVILHGTDTMVYTASALSFMLRGLDKPVVLTGAQRSAMVDVRNDATQNMITAILVANSSYSGVPHLSEVVICFGGLILRGNRTVKVDTSGYRAYTTPNIPALGEAGNRIFIDDTLIRPRPTGAFRPRFRLDTNVTPIFIFPGIQNTDLVRRQLAAPDLKAAIVHAYGSGDIPTDPEFLGAFAEARDRDVVLAAVTQCARGPVELGIYDTSAALLEAGFVDANDITVEAAQCKLMALLGDPDISKEEVEELFQQNLAGEQSTSVYLTRYPGAANKSVEGPTKGEKTPGVFRVPGRPLEGTWDAAQIDRALLRLRGGRVQGAEREPGNFRVFINAEPGEDLTDSHPGYAGTFRKYTSADTPLIIFDVTAALIPVASPAARVSFTISLDTTGTSCSWESIELALRIREGGA